MQKNIGFIIEIFSEKCQFCRNINYHCEKSIWNVEIFFVNIVDHWQNVYNLLFLYHDNISCNFSQDIVNKNNILQIFYLEGKISNKH